jgi:hypothetical protein
MVVKAMKRTMSFLVITIALATAIVTFEPSAANAGRCGDRRVDDGEECDHGKYNGQTCCDAQCRRVPAGAACLPAPHDPCGEGVCDAEHICQIPKSGYVDPCTRSPACRRCIATGPLTGNYTCTGTPSDDGVACADDAGEDHLCTVDVCKAGECTHVAKECPAGAGGSGGGRCNPKTGACDDSAAAPPGKQSRRD